MLSKNAIGNLINRYKAVLKKCYLINKFGSLAMAGAVLAGVGISTTVQASGNTYDDIYNFITTGTSDPRTLTITTVSGTNSHDNLGTTAGTPETLTLTIDGDLIFDGNSKAGITIASGYTLNFQVAEDRQSTISNFSQAFNNSGIINFRGTSTLNSTDNDIHNEGIINIGDAFSNATVSLYSGYTDNYDINSKYLNVSTGSTLNLHAASTVQGSLVNNGTVNFYAASNISGCLTNGGTVNVYADTSIIKIQDPSSYTFLNGGTVNVGDSSHEATFSIKGYYSFLYTGNFTVSSGSTLVFEPNNTSYGNNTLYFSITNSGTVNINPLNITSLTIDGTVTNSGTLNLKKITTITDTVTNSGTLNLVQSANIAKLLQTSGSTKVLSGYTLTLGSGSSLASGSVLNNAGTVQISSGTTTFAGVTGLDSGAIAGTVAVNNTGKLSITEPTSLSSVSIAYSGILDITASTNITNVSIANSGTLDVKANTNITALSQTSGTMKISSGITLTLGNGNSLASGSVLDNAGIVQISSGTTTFAGVTGLNSGAIAGTIAVNGTGKLSITGATTLDSVSVADTGVLDIKGNTNITALSQTSGTTKITGSTTTLTLGSGSSFASGSVLDNAGTVQISSGTTTFAGVTGLNSGAIAGTIAVNGTGTLSLTGETSLTTVSITNSGTLDVKANTNITNATIANSGILDVKANTSVTTLSQTGGTTTILSGKTLTLGSGSSLASGSVLDNAGTVQISSGTTTFAGVIGLNSGSITGTVAVNNSGILSITAQTALTDVTVGNTGTLTVSENTNISKLTQTSGTVTIDSTKTLTLGSGSLLAGTVSNAGTLQIESGTVTLDSTATYSGAGTITVTNTSALSVLAPSLTGTINNSGTVNIYGNTTINGTLNNINNAAIDMQEHDAQTAFSTLTIGDYGTLAGSAELKIDVNMATSGSEKQSDKISISSLGAASGATLHLSDIKVSGSYTSASDQYVTFVDGNLSGLTINVGVYDSTQGTYSKTITTTDGSHIYTFTQNNSNAGRLDLTLDSAEITLPEYITGTKSLALTLNSYNINANLNMTGDIGTTAGEDRPTASTLIVNINNGSTLSGTNTGTLETPNYTAGITVASGYALNLEGSTLEDGLMTHVATMTNFAQALNNSGTLNINGVNFIGNVSKSNLGGAIYNSSLINGITFSGTTTFSDNFVDYGLEKTANDIFNAGIINIGINNETTGIVNIYSGYEDNLSGVLNVQAESKLNFYADSTVSGSLSNKGTVTVGDGTNNALLTLSGSYTDIAGANLTVNSGSIINITKNTSIAGTLTNNSTISLQNNTAGTVLSVANMTGTGSLAIDIYLDAEDTTKNASDRLTIQSSAYGTLNLSNIVLTVDGTFSTGTYENYLTYLTKDSAVTLPENYLTVGGSVGNIAIMKDNSSYLFTKGTELGKLTLVVGAAPTLSDYLSGNGITALALQSYILQGTITETSDLAVTSDNKSDKTWTINMSAGSTLSGDSTHHYTGINVSKEDHTLTINGNGGTIRDFTVALTNSGAVNINSVIFTANTSTGNGGALYNTSGHTVNFIGVNSFSDNTDSTGSNDIHNTGIINIGDGAAVATLTLSSGYTGINDILNIKSNSILNINYQSSSTGTSTWTNNGILNINADTSIVSLNQNTVDLDPIISIADTATLTLSGDSQLSNGKLNTAVDGYTATNGTLEISAGTTTFAGITGAGTDGTITGIIKVDNSGTLAIAVDTNIAKLSQTSGGTTTVSSGKILTIGNESSFGSGSYLNNAGIIQISNGTTTFAGVSGTDADGTIDGIIMVSDEATLAVSADTKIAKLYQMNGSTKIIGSATTLTLGNGTSLASGTVLDNAGIVQISSGKTTFAGVTGNGGASIGGTVTINGTGTLSISGGTSLSAVSVADTGVLDIKGNTNITALSQTSGKTQIAANKTLTLGNGSSFAFGTVLDNAGIVRISSGTATFDGVTGNGGGAIAGTVTIDGTGTLSISGGTSLTSVSVADSGVLDIKGNTNITVLSQTSGKTQTLANKTLTLGNGSSFASGSVLDNAGTIQISTGTTTFAGVTGSNGGTITGIVTVNNNGILSITKNTSIASVAIADNGTLEIAADTNIATLSQVSGGITAISSGKTLTLGDGTSLAGVLTNNGNLTIDSGKVTLEQTVSYGGAGNIIINKDAQNGATLSVLASSLSFEGNITNSGHLNIGDLTHNATLALNGSYTDNTDAVLEIITGSLLNINNDTTISGTLTNNGTANLYSATTISGTLTNKNIVNVGDSTHITTLVLNGSYTDTSDAVLEVISGSKLNINTDTAISGKLTNNGTANVYSVTTISGTLTNKNIVNVGDSTHNAELSLSGIYTDTSDATLEVNVGSKLNINNDTAISGKLTNNGTVNAYSAAVITGNLTNNNAVTIGDNTHNTSLTLQGNYTDTSDSSLIVNSGSSLKVKADTAVSGLLTNNGTVEILEAALTLSGSYAQTGTNAVTNIANDASLNLTIANITSGTMSNVGTLNITTGIFNGSTSTDNGGAINNSGTATLGKVSFINSSSTANGGAVFNSGTVNFNDTVVFSDNKDQNAANTNDIYNIGTININNGAYITLSAAESPAAANKIYVGTDGTTNGILNFQGGTLVADFGTFLNASDLNKLEKLPTVGTVTGTNTAGGYLILRSSGVFNKNTYSLDQLKTAMQNIYGVTDVAMLTNTLSFEGATLGDIGEGSRVVALTVPTGDIPTIKQIAVQDSNGNKIVQVYDVGYRNIVLLDSANNIITADVVSAGGKSFTAKALQLTPKGTDVTFNINDGANVTFAGDDSPIVDTSDTAVKTKVNLSGQSSMTITGDMSEGNLISLKTSGGGNSFIIKNGGKVKINSLNMSGGSEDNINLVKVGYAEAAEGGDLLVVSSLTLPKYSSIIVDPSWEQKTSAVAVENIADGIQNGSSFGGNAGVARNSMLTLGTTDTNWLNTGMKEAGYKKLKEKNGVSAAFGLYKALDIASSGGSLYVDGSKDETTIYSAMQGVSDGSAYFAPNSLFVVNGNIAGSSAETAALKAKTITVKNNAKLHLTNIKRGTTYYIATASEKLTINGNGWSDTNLTNSINVSSTLSNDSHSAWVTVDNITVTLPKMQSSLLKAVNNLITKYGIDTNSSNIADKFISRAITVLSSNPAAAAIEGAAKIAFAGAVPQMNLDLSQRMSNALASRDFLSSPPGIGAAAGNSENGFTLWALPTYQYSRGHNFKSGNFSSGYESNAGGMALGGDYTMNNSLRFGVAINGGGGKIESDGEFSETKNNMNYIGANAYASWKYNKFTLFGQFGFLRTDNDLTQKTPSIMNMSDSKADGVNSTVYSAGLRASYQIVTHFLELVPYVEFDYYHVHTSGFSVKNSGQTMFYNGSVDSDFLQIPIGINMKKTLSDSNGWNIKGALDLAVIPTIGNPSASQDVRINGISTNAAITHVITDRVSGRASVGIEASKGNFSVGLNYTFQAGSHTTNHGVQAVIGWKF